MKKVTMHECDFCGELFSEEELCIQHENRHMAIDTANQMLEEGCTLKEINDETHIWSNVPEYLANINHDNCFSIPYIQHCKNPAYRIKRIELNGKLYLYGCGNWTGYKGCLFGINSRFVTNPRPKEELFISEHIEWRIDI